MPYITIPINSEPEDMIADAIRTLQSYFPGWQPTDASLDTIMLEAVAANAADLRDIAALVPDTIWRVFGASLVGVQPVDASPAQTTTTWTLGDNGGHTIEAGTQVGIRDASGQLVPFEVLNEVIVPPGSTVTAAGEVEIIAVNPGEATSGLGSAGGSVELIDPLDWVASIVQVDITTGGVDAETSDEYNDRLTSELQLLSPRPILPNDFAVLALTISGVWRAVAVDGYNTVDSTYNNPRMVTVAAIDTLGSPVPSGVKASIASYLESLREVNFVVNTVDPTTTAIDVTVNVTVLSGEDPATVVAAIETALTNYLDPATWGTTADDDRAWSNVTTVRYLEIATVINNVSGVDTITTTGGLFDLEIGISGGALGRADVDIPGVVPLADAGTLTVTTS